MSRNRSRSQSRQKYRAASIWISVKTILFFLILVGTGFLLAFAGTAQSGLQGVLFGTGILLWVVGVFGAVYCIVRRLAGAKAANLAVLALFLFLLGELFSGKGRENDHDTIDRRDY